MFASPRRCASRFISATNASSEPATASASATAASLPDCTIMPRRRSGTATDFPAAMNMRDPEAFAAACETVMGRAASSLVSRSAWKTTYAVMSLVSEAGSKRSFSLAAASAWPLSRSVRR